jgi:hypothetical protein
MYPGVSHVTVATVPLRPCQAIVPTSMGVSHVTVATVPLERARAHIHGCVARHGRDRAVAIVRQGRHGSVAMGEMTPETTGGNSTADCTVENVLNTLKRLGWPSLAPDTLKSDV